MFPMKYRGFVIQKAHSPQGWLDSGTGEFRHIHFPISYGDEFSADLAGCAVLPSAGDKTWQDAKETVDLLIAVGFTPEKGEGDFYEYYALEKDLRFRRAYASNKYLPEDKKFHRAEFTIVGFTHAIVYDGSVPMANMPEYDKVNGNRSSWTVDPNRFPKRLRKEIKMGAVFSCLCNMSTTDLMYGGIRLVKRATRRQKAVRVA